MLYNAEEPVSPGVWSAVAAGLDAKHRVVPVWLWGAVAFAAAAAVAVGVFLWRPSGLRLEEYSPASPLAALSLDSPLSGEIVKPALAGYTAPSRENAPVATREEASLEAVQNATIIPEALLKQTSRLAMVPRSSYVPTVEDNYLLNQLAWEEKPVIGRDFSLTAAGNLQASSRGQAFSRRGAAAPASTYTEGITYKGDDRPGMPFSAGVGIKWNLAPRWAIGTGVRYTNLSRSFTGFYVSNDGWTAGDENNPIPIDNIQHWIGVPLNVYYDFVSTPHWRVHAFAGGAMDYLLQNKFTIHWNTDIPWNKPGTSFQWSAGIGAGAEYLITKNVGIYLDPSVRYYFNEAAGADINGLPVHPVRFVVEAGIRFSLGRY